MLTLVAGLVLFLGAHSVRVFAEGWRAATIARVGEKPWKGVYSLVSLAGFVLLVVGYGMARHHPVVLWSPPPVALRHVASLLTLVAFVLVVAAYVPGNGVHVCFHANSVEEVRAFHAKALELGGQDEGKPGLRREYADNYYAAFVRDPDGNKIEAVFLLKEE